jgi:hypothetical protein
MAIFATKPSGPCTKGFPIGCLVVLAAAGRTGAFTRGGNPGEVVLGLLVLAAVAYVICRAIDAQFFA